MSVSIITACKNRSKALSVSIASWIQCDEVDEIIVTDWNSDGPIDHLARLSKKIKIINVKDEPYFNQPQPLNLAASLVTSDYILKLDCDHVLNPYFNFFDLHQLEENKLIVGFNSLVDNEFLHPLWGLLYVKTETFRKVGGYNENMGKYYAVEDDELCTRLMSYGCTPIPIQINNLSALHIPHTDKDRVKNFESFQKIQKILDVEGTNFNQGYNENLFYNYAAQICKRKNLEDHPLCSKIKKIFEQKSYDQLGWIDWYCEPIYKWEISQQGDQIYKAIKLCQFQ
jgi:predicted glycosyltransferase involved in capsule biosynthesis